MAGTPSFSILVPVTDANLYLASFTLDSIAGQSYPFFEIVLIDGRKKEKSQDFFEGYRSHIRKTLLAQGGDLFSILNQGVSLAEGEYIHVLIPGEYYLSKHALNFVADFVQQQNLPDLMCTGRMLRQSLCPPEISVEETSLQDLKKGKLTSCLQSAWFRKSALLKEGGFDPRFKWQGGQDMICRFYLRANLKKSFMRRVLVDYEYRRPPPGKVIRLFWETLVILCRHFGLGKALLWWTAQNHLRLLSWWLKSIQGAFSRKFSNKFAR